MSLAIGHSHRRDMGQRGSAVLEFALSIPLWITLVIGTIEMGRAWLDYNLLTYAVREGARLATVTPDLEQNDQVVFDRINQVLLSGGLQLERSRSFVEYTQANRTVRVRAETDYTPIVLQVWSANDPHLKIPLKAEVTTTYEL